MCRKDEAGCDFADDFLEGVAPLLWRKVMVGDAGFEPATPAV